MGSTTTTMYLCICILYSCFLPRGEAFKLRHFLSTTNIYSKTCLLSTSTSTSSDQISYKDLLKLTISGFNTGAWFPIGPPSTLDKTLPFSIEVAGEKLVVWNNNNPLEVETNLPTKGWSVMRDICPHRLAPLSQGRVDPQTGCIECPYHGWQFNSTGTYKCIYSFI